jgi:hypothetical protein
VDNWCGSTGPKRTLSLSRSARLRQAQSLPRPCSAHFAAAIHTLCNACRVTGTNVHVRFRGRRYMVGGRLNTISVSRSWPDMSLPSTIKSACCHGRSAAM